MSLKLAAGVSILCAGSPPAEAERSIEIELAQPAPFQVAELAAALRMRLPTDGAPVRVRVSPTPDGDGVRVDAAPGSRDVSLHGLAGTAAARLVALAASDLLLDDLAAAPELVVRGAASARAPLSLGITGSIAGWDGLLAAGSLDLVIPRRGFVAAIELGGGAVAGGPLDLVAGIARFDGGVRLGAFELRGGLTLAPIIVRTGAGDTTVLAGGNASARYRIPVTRGARAVLAIGTDVFATRTQYVLDGMTAATTPRFAPWFAAGMEVGL